ncbi:hypothetical protein OsI_11341 [Oryza sativa Indica Group]|uniref:Uncharacterized protein n=1 Tax=Oryza sativa subsp. indica TaxID=39946 RepID=B8ANG9_ORYSI|nr:hypothetical protein OsI_11341 [Oryza sativa Indica Group]
MAYNEVPFPPTQPNPTPQEALNIGGKKVVGFHREIWSSAIGEEGDERGRERAHQASHHQAVEEEEEDPEDDQGGDKAKDEVQEEGGKQEGVVKRGRRIRMENRKYKGAEWAV